MTPREPNGSRPCEPAAGAPQIQESQLRSRDQARLHALRVGPPAPRARLAWIHGFAEHGGRYLPALRWLAERGFESTIVDLRGHGRSSGRRAYVGRFAEYLDDAEALLAHLGAEPRPLPLIVLGHSMGGLIVARLLQDRSERLPELAGAVLLSPFLGLRAALPSWKVGAGRVLSRVLPWAALPTGVDVAHLSTDPAVGRAYLDDPLVSKRATARWFTECEIARAQAVAEAARLRLPVLVMHGEDDRLVDPEATRRFHASLGRPDATLRLWPCLRHELLNERTATEVLEALLEWLVARIGAPRERASGTPGLEQPS